MAIGSMTPRLHPLQRGGGGSSSGLPLGFPTLVSARRTPALAMWDDFIAGVSVGTTAASRWTLTQAGSGAGSAGIVNASNSTTTATLGVFQATTGTTANDLSLLELSQRNAASNSIFPVSNTTENGGFTAMFRLAFGPTRTFCKHGCGLIGSSIANGTDWITDPETTLGGDSNQHLIIHRHASAYGSGGMAAAAGDVVARYYDGTVGDQLLTLVASASLTSSPVKVEFDRPAGSTTMTVYVNGAAVGTFTTHTGASNWRPSFGIITETTTARNISLDAFFLEAGTTMPAR